MQTKIIIDPITRIEGHLKVEAVVENGRVVEGRLGGMLYRGIGQMLVGREPADSVKMTQRICGVCPVSQGLAAAQCTDNAQNIVPPDNGRIIRNLIEGANQIQSHILHFYHLAALDFVRGPNYPPFIPRYEGDYRLSKAANDQLVANYVQALQMRLKAHEMGAIFAGKLPHSASIVPGGATVLPAVDRITTFLWRLNELREFIDKVYLPDVFKVANAYRDQALVGVGCKNMLSFGAFDLDNTPAVANRSRFFKMGVVRAGKYEALKPAAITQDVSSSWFEPPTTIAPSDSSNLPNPAKPSGYSWVKSPRYEGAVFEVGPLARAVVARAGGGNPAFAKALDSALTELKLKPDHLYSLLGRHLTRALETKVLADAMTEWVLQIDPSKSAMAYNDAPPEQSQGVGLWDAPRGALGHWMSLKGGKIQHYEVISPTAWNASPRDEKGQPGPIEQALVGAPVKDTANPFSVARIVRSFDPCIACAIHLITPSGELLKQFRAI
jgi:hydrogenase large subunit